MLTKSLIGVIITMRQKSLQTDKEFKVHGSNKLTHRHHRQKWKRYATVKHFANIYPVNLPCSGSTNTLIPDRTILCLSSFDDLLQFTHNKDLHIRCNSTELKLRLTFIKFLDMSHCKKNLNYPITVTSFNFS